MTTIDWFVLNEFYRSMFEFKLRIYFRRKFDINIFFRKYSNALFVSFPIFPLLSFSHFVRKFFVGQISSEKRKTRITFCTRSPFSFERCCACLLGRHGVPPLRSWGQSISNLTFLPTNDLVHRRIYEPPLFLPFSIALVYFRPNAFVQTESRFNGWFDGTFFFENFVCCRKHWIFFRLYPTAKRHFANIYAKNILLKCKILRSSRFLIQFFFFFWGYVV